MSGKQRPSPEELANLVGQPNFGRPASEMPSTDPITQTPMFVPIEQLEKYDRNPRRSINPKYDEIKVSIRQNGLTEALSITRRPGAANYMMDTGSGTRLQILKELFAETHGEEFKQIHCLFNPWEGEEVVLARHLGENENRGSLTFIDKAHGIEDLRSLAEAESDEQLTLRAFSTYLGVKGFRASPGVLLSVNYAVRSLENVIPVALQAGLSRIKVERIRKLHKAFVATWESLDIPDLSVGESLFLELLARFDAETIDLEAVRIAAEGELSVSAEIDVQHVKMVFGAAVDGRDLGSILAAGDDKAAAPPTEPRSEEDDKAAAPPTEPRFEEDDKAQSGPGKDSEGQGSRPSTIPTRSTTAAPPNEAALRQEAHRLACTAATILGSQDIVERIDNGLGFRVGPIPADIRQALPVDQHPALDGAWLMLATVSEQGSSRTGSDTANDFPSAVSIADFAVLGLHRVSDEFFSIWCDLIATTRKIYAVTNDQPWAQGDSDV